MWVDPVIYAFATSRLIWCNSFYLGSMCLWKQWYLGDQREWIIITFHLHYSFLFLYWFCSEYQRWSTFRQTWIGPCQAPLSWPIQDFAGIKIHADQSRLADWVFSVEGLRLWNRRKAGLLRAECKMHDFVLIISILSRQILRNSPTLELLWLWSWMLYLCKG